MKIRRLQVKNFRSIRDVVLQGRDVLALVGANNTGKSNILKALELFFEDSARLVDEDCYHRGPDGEAIDEPIVIEVTFDGLNDWEKEQLGPWLASEDCLVVRKQFAWDGEKCEIKRYAVTRVPSDEWLRADAITQAKVAEWWGQIDDLVAGDARFSDYVGTTKPTVAEWKDAAKQFVADHADEIEWEEATLENPKGYSGVLKGTLPKFVLVPAVRDLMDETKVTQTNPFGLLIAWMLERMSDADRDLLASRLQEVRQLVGEADAGKRIEAIGRLEGRLNELLSEVIQGCVLEIEMRIPTVDDIFRDVRVYADDGVRSGAETKGHGVQRSLIFTLLRACAGLEEEGKTDEEAGRRQTLIFAIEEPELYLHPQSQRAFRDVLWQIGDGDSQVLYSTHSSLFVDVSRFDDICIVRRTPECQTCVRQVSMEDMLADLKKRKGVNGTEEGIRDLYSAAFGTSVNEGFFASKVVVVEGPSEAYALPLYARAVGYGFDQHNVAIVHGHGKGQMDRLWRIFTAFEIPTYLVFDGDKSNDDTERHRETLELLECAGATVKSIEDVCTDVGRSHAVFEETFDDVIRQEVADYDELCTQCKEKLGPSGATSKPLRHRFVARQLLKRFSGGDIGCIPPTIAKVVEAIRDCGE